MPVKSNQWRIIVQRLVKAELSKKAVKYQELSDKLKAIGVEQSADNLRNKVSKGILGADLLLQIMYVLNVKQIRYSDLDDMLEDLQGD